MRLIGLEIYSKKVANNLTYKLINMNEYIFIKKADFNIRIMIKANFYLDAVNALRTIVTRIEDYEFSFGEPKEDLN